MLLLHGFGHTRRAWDRVIPHLVAHRDVVAVDLPGHGASPLPAGARTLGVPDLVALVETFLDGLDVEAPVVAGNSLGGAMALELLRRGSVRAAVALAPIGFWSRWDAGYAEAVLRSSHTLARGLRAALPALVRQPAVRALTFGAYFADPSRLGVDEALRTARDFAETPGFDVILPGCRRYHFATSADIDQDAVTIAWGDRDRLLLRHQAARARRLLPAARHIRIRDAGHVPMVDAPERVAELILER